ncbi:MAG: tRNA pseudouridine(55) synthase TruB [Clostridia bacterium]|nr:tRNA pseudouridine(55) synthase TruB [Clostridia bacterium]
MVGIFNINKGKGVNSSSVVAKIKHLTKEKVGHLGTLDPMATGVLLVAVGKATRLFDLFLEKNKEYVFSAKFGVETDTLDADGQIVETNNKIPNRAEIEAILPSFVGKQLQVPPQYSAKKVNGKRAYDLARKGESVNLAPKEIEVVSLELLSFGNDEASFKMSCSAGTYVRSVVRDIAHTLKTLATTTEINRTKAGKFALEDSKSLDEILTNPEKNIISLHDVLEGLNTVQLNEAQTGDLLCGKVVKVDGNKSAQNIVILTPKDEIYGIADIDNGRIKVKAFLL